MIFPYSGNPLFPCFGNCMDFCIKRKISEILNFEMFVFSHIFSLLWEFTFPIFWELYGFLLHPKYLKLWNVCFFSPYFFRFMEFTFPMFWELYGFLLHPKYLRNFGIFTFFLILFPYYGNSLFPSFGNCMDFCFIQNF